MYSGIAQSKPNPKEGANVLNRLFFWWIMGIFRISTRRALLPSDMYAPLKADESERLGDYLEKYWNCELEKLKGLEYIVDKDGNKAVADPKKMPRLYKAICRAFWFHYFCSGVPLFIQAVVLRTAVPIFQGYVTSYFNVTHDNSYTKTETVVNALILVFITAVAVQFNHHGILMGQKIGMQVRIACSTLIYRKILRLSKGALTQTAAGQIINILSNDCSRFEELPIYLNYIWILPIQVLVIGYIMWEKVGMATFPGILTLCLMTFPVNAIFTWLSLRLRIMIASLTDKRIQLMSELIAGIQVIKMYAWERPFANIVSHTRVAEMNKIIAASYIRALYVATILYTDRTCLFVSLVTYALLGNPITADKAFVLMSYFNVLQTTFAVYFPQGLILSGESMVSVSRIEEFLLLDEVSNEQSTSVSTIENRITKLLKSNQRKATEKNGIKNATNSTTDGFRSFPVSIVLDRISANWILGQLPPTLCNISVEIKGGQLCALIGTVGSGKSSLLHLLMKELPLGAGTVKLHQMPLDKEVSKKRGYVTDNPNLNISYASQAAWLFTGTVRENILFGEPYDKNKYAAVTKACALVEDFTQLPHGDLSNVGENGSSLSGGQKARVNLARAVYREADLYLLDDPLSAVDARVAKHLFTKCIENYLRGKTRILVTHQVQFIKQADNIVVLDRGCVKMQGSYKKLSEMNEEFTRNYVRVHEDENKQENEPRDVMFRRRSSARASIKSVDSTTTSIASQDYDGIADTTQDEEMYLNGFWKVFKKYFHHGGSWCVLSLLIVIFTLGQVAITGADYWVSYWSNLETIRAGNITADAAPSGYSSMANDTFLASIFDLDNRGLLTTNSAIYVYMVCLFTGIILTTVRVLFYMKISMNASRNLHNLMFSNLLQAPMKFFQENASGRILNRFSKDTGAMDERLPRVMLEAIQIGMLMCAIFVLVAILNYWMILPIIFLGISTFILTKYYVRTVQGTKRIETMYKSPVFSHVNSTLNGLTTIRCSGPRIHELLRKQFDLLQDAHSGAYYLMVNAATAFGLYLDLISCIFLGCVCFSFILLDIGNVLGGSAGLAISQCLLILGTLQYGVRQSAEMVSQMTSVERILQYMNIPKEGALTSNNPPPPTWPQNGRLTLRNVSLRYDADEPPVLKNLNVTIEPGWKVGVVGRTGAGKSSLISALFRLHPEGIEGEIKIDERDTSTLGLHELRSRLSIIPQQPVLFSESLRYNLDPFDTYDDVVLWDVLREVELGDYGLDQMVQESGTNFSVGQRQLICLARAILRNNKILVLDEATANIDIYTDSLIQNTIRMKFADRTVITVAHRLNTIIDSDRIIVIDCGRIVEFGCPYELLRNNPNGDFAQMVDKTGKVMAQTLWEQAEKACMRNNAQRSLGLTQENSVEADAVTVTAEYTL